MQTEESQDQAEASTETTVEHFHMRLFADGVTNQDTVTGHKVDWLVKVLHKNLDLSFDTAEQELDGLADAGESDEEIGRAYLRLKELGRLHAMFDPRLFDHVLFEDAAGYQGLLRGVFLSLLDDAMGFVPITEEYSMQAVPCVLPKEECPQYAEWLAKQETHQCPGCGNAHDHEPHAGIVFQDGDGNTLGKIDLPFPGEATTFGEIRDRIKEGLAGMFVKDATEKTGDNVAD